MRGIIGAPASLKSHRFVWFQNFKLQNEFGCA